MCSINKAENGFILEMTSTFQFQLALTRAKNSRVTVCDVYRCSMHRETPSRIITTKQYVNASNKSVIENENKLKPIQFKFKWHILKELLAQCHLTNFHALKKNKKLELTASWFLVQHFNHCTKPHHRLSLSQRRL